MEEVETLHVTDGPPRHLQTFEPNPLRSGNQVDGTPEWTFLNVTESSRSRERLGYPKARSM